MNQNRDIADMLERMGILLEIKGEIIFKTRAYLKAADNIRNLSDDIRVFKDEGRLRDIEGVGKEIEAKITEYLDTGGMTSYKKLTEEVPESLLELVDVSSVGPKRAKLFFDKLNIRSLADLKKAAESGQLAQLEKLGEKSVQKILKGLVTAEQGRRRMNLGTAMTTAEEVIALLKDKKAVQAISFAGSLRRGCETVGDIDILVKSRKPEDVMEAFCSLPIVKTIQARGETKSSILTTSLVQVDLRVVPPESYGAAQLYFTGSKAFNIEIRQIAQKKNMKVNEYGVFRIKNGRETRVAGKSEAECLKALGLPDFPPELREEIGGKKLYSLKRVPSLIEEKDIQGDLHVHSVYSDGKDTIEAMARAAKARGYSYLAICDHSPKLPVARGVSPADLKKKKKEIDKLNAKMSGFRILFGTEVEIDSDGNLDYNDAILSGFDIVVAAVHSGFDQGRDKLTKRILKAVTNKRVHIIAHPTGVNLGKRAAYDIDFPLICRACVDHNVCLEINAFPVRLDLNSSHVFDAKKRGVRFVINTDSHRVEHLAHLRYGISVARRGWLAKKDVLNVLSLSELLKSLKK